MEGNEISSELLRLLYEQWTCQLYNAIQHTQQVYLLKGQTDILVEG